MGKDRGRFTDQLSDPDEEGLKGSELITLDPTVLNRLTSEIAEKVFERTFKSPKLHNKIIVWQLGFEVILIAVIAVTLGYGIAKINELREIKTQIFSIEREKIVLSKQKDLAEKALQNEREEKAALSKLLGVQGLDLVEVRIAEKIQSFYNRKEKGHSRYTRDLSYLRRFVRAAIEIQRYFPECGKTPKERIYRALAIAGKETNFNRDTIGALKEVSAFQILPRDIPLLMDQARKEGFAISDDPRDIKTSTVLMFIHLRSKMKIAGTDYGKGVRLYNGRLSKPTYWLGYLEFFNWFSDLNVDERLFISEEIKIQ